MGTLNRNVNRTMFGSIAAAVSGLFGNKKFKTPEYHPRGKTRFAGHQGTGVAEPAGSKIRRAIKRGNHGLVNKHGMIGYYFAEKKRENWLLARGKVVIRLSTTV